MKKWIIFLIVILVLVSVSLTLKLWLNPLLSFTGANTSLIQGLTSLIQLALYIISGIYFVIKIFGSIKKLKSDSLVPPKPKKTIKPIQNIDWKKLHNAFTLRNLDKILIKHIGGKLEGPSMLPIKEIFFEQDAGGRSFEKCIENYKLEKMTEEIEFLKIKGGFLDGHIWRLLNEKRDIVSYHIELKEKESMSSILKVFIQQLKNNQSISDPEHFQKSIDIVAKQCNISSDKMIVVLKQFFESSIIRKSVLSYLIIPSSYLIIGDAGAGKTTLLRKICVDMFENSKKKRTGKTMIPVFVRLDKVADFMNEKQTLEKAKKALLTVICKHWEPDLTCEEDLTILMLENSNNKIQIMLDGLDEIPSADLRMKLANVVNSMIHKDGYNILMTSRPAAVDDILLESLNIPHCELLSLSEKQVKEFSHQFFAIYESDIDESKKDADNFITALERSKTALEFSRNPLYLTVMILMHKKHDVLPQKRIQLYAEFYEMLLLQRKEESDQNKQSDSPVFICPVPNKNPIQWSETVYTPLLRRIAYITHSHDKDSVSVSLKTISKAIRSRRGLFDETEGISEKKIAEKFLNFADEQLGVLVSRGSFYGFSHRSLQEYLAAMHLSNLDKKEIESFWKNKIIKRPDRWSEIARLLICEIRETEFLFPFLENQWIRDIQDTNDPAVIAIIGSVLFDLQKFFEGGSGIRALHRMVIKALKNKINNSWEKPNIFLACGDALGLMDEPHIEVSNPPVVKFEPEKPFQMGSNEHEREQPIHPVQLSPYWFGVYPVTNKEFEVFIRDGGYDKEDYWFCEKGKFRFDGREFLNEPKGKHPRYWNNERFGISRPLAPVVGVSWFEAMAYCKWWTEKYGDIWAKNNNINHKIIMRLPTEAEWEFAAKGHEDRKYPWGDEKPDYSRANYGWEKNIGRTTSVGSYSFGNRAEKIFDMAGNVWEWCYDKYNEDYYDKCFKESEKIGRAIVDPVGLDLGDYCVLRGGSFDSDTGGVRCACRYRSNPYYRYDNVGFRLVLSPFFL
jgi:formylglycine-generating enzyme required for sulfatase activity